MYCCHQLVNVKSSSNLANQSGSVNDADNRKYPQSNFGQFQTIARKWTNMDQDGPILNKGTDCLGLPTSILQQEIHRHIVTKAERLKSCREQTKAGLLCCGRHWQTIPNGIWTIFRQTRKFEIGTLPPCLSWNWTSLPVFYEIRLVQMGR